MQKIVFFSLALFALHSCTPTKNTSIASVAATPTSATLKIEGYSNDSTYGYTEKNPIKVGGGSNGPSNERAFLNSLTGPNGEKLEFTRLGSCCPFETPNSAFGGMLDKYNITYPGLKKNIILYINMYDFETLMVPVGFKKKS